jgi:hypothetical protein
MATTGLQMVGWFDLGTRQSWIPWQLVVNGQQGFSGIIEYQIIGHSHLSPHCVAAEDHPWAKNRELAKRLVKLPRIDG